VRGARAAARVAGREVRRRPGRTALVTALVALPVAATTLAALLVRTEPRTPLEHWRSFGGQADAVRFLDVDEADDPTAGLPAGTRAVVVRHSYVPVRTAGGDATEVDVSDVPLADPLARGIVDVVDGRAPRAAGEVALTRTLADDLGAGTGDTVDLLRPLAMRWHVVGAIEQPDCLTCRIAVVAPGPAWPFPEWATSVSALLDLPPGATPEPGDPSLQLRDRMIATDTRTAGEDETVRWAFVFGALSLTVAGIVIAAAFAVGARRQLVTIGQLAATGAGPSVVRAALVLQGTVSGVIGTVTGLAAGAALAAVGRGWVEHAVDHRIGPWEVRLTDVLAVGVLGVAAATAAALVPAVTAARVPTLDALAGRRPLRPVPRWLTAAGLAAVAAGLALLALAVVGSRSQQDGDLWTLVAIAGGVVEVFGACAVAPAVVARLEPLAARASGVWRLAARSLARQRTRSGGVLSAVAAAGGLAVAAGALALGLEARNAGDWLPMADDTVVAGWVDPGAGDAATLASTLEAVGDITGDRDPTMIRTVPLPAGTLPSVVRRAGSVEQSFVDAVRLDRPVVADPQLLADLDVPAAARTALDEVGAVVLVTGEDGPATVTIGPRTFPARLVTADHDVAGTSLLLAPDVAEATAHSLDVNTLAWVAEDPLDDDERDALRFLMFDLGYEHRQAPGFELLWAERPSGPSPAVVELVLAGLALAFSLFVVGTGLALAAAEGKDERDVLAVAGAPPTALAKVAGAKAWLLTSLGAAVAVPVGFLPVVVTTPLAEAPFPLVVPVRTIVVLVVAAPLAAAAVSAAASAVAHRVRPVRVSTAAFE
jgi:putative ABC transport system permease protein